MSGVGACCGTVFPVSVVVGAAGGGVPLGAVPALSWCGEVSLGGIHIIIIRRSIAKNRLLMGRPWFGLHKILIYFNALLWESIILLLPPRPIYKAYPVAILLHDHCAIYAPPPTPLFLCHTPYNIGDGNIV